MFNFNKHMIMFAVAATLATVIFIFFMIIILITFKNKQIRKNKENLLALVAEKDRTMYLISLEVHDNVNQMLNIVSWNLGWLKSYPADEENDLRINQTWDIVQTLIMDTNNISHTLNTEYLQKKGLIISLKEEVEWVNKSKKIDCKLNITGITKKFESQTELMIFRIAQEAINNTIKHAEASQITIKLNYEPDCFEMIIADNGVGFDYSPDLIKGVGMHSMSQRAKIVDGVFAVQSKNGSGTSIILRIPIINANRKI